jgi:hypothetical protein
MVTNSVQMDKTYNYNHLMNLRSNSPFALVKQVCGISCCSCHQLRENISGNSRTPKPEGERIKCALSGPTVFSGCDCTLGSEVFPWSW